MCVVIAVEIHNYCAVLPPHLLLSTVPWRCMCVSPYCLPTPTYHLSKLCYVQLDFQSIFINSFVLFNSIYSSIYGFFFCIYYFFSFKLMTWYTSLVYHQKCSHFSFSINCCVTRQGLTRVDLQPPVVTLSGQAQSSLLSTTGKDSDLTHHTPPSPQSGKTINALDVSGKTPAVTSP